MKGTDFIATLPEAAGPEREQKILDAVRAGLHLPIRWAPIHAAFHGHEATLHVAEDALAIGEPDDFVRVTVTHATAQRIADVLHAALPTTQISDLAHAQATVVLRACPQAYDNRMSTTSRMVQHHRVVEAQRAGRTGLTRTVGKDWVLTNRLVGQPQKAANYGWHSPDAPYVLCDGTHGWQPLGLAHNLEHVDYSQTLCLVRRDVVVDGKAMDLLDVLRSPELWGLVSDEGPLHIVRHPGVPEAQSVVVSHEEERGGLGQRALAVAQRELAEGVCEQPLGSNSGPRVRNYLAPCVRDTRLPDGSVERRTLGLTAAPWCAAFASYCASTAAAPDELPPHAYRASVAELWRDAVASGAAQPPSYKPRIGDLAIYMRDGNNPTKGGLGHVGRVCSEVDADGIYETIEGNVDNRVTRVRHKHGDTVGWIAYAAPAATERAVAFSEEGEEGLPQRDAAPPEGAPLLRLADALTGAAPLADGALAIPEAPAFLRAPAPAGSRADEYRALYTTCEIQHERLAEIDALVDKIAAARPRYQAVTTTTSVPWYVVGIIHAMECSLRFDQHLHNGDPLTQRTVHVPAGRPAGQPPFKWETSAEDALRLARLDAWKDWTVAGTLGRLEAYNGMGYRRVVPPIDTPYLWSYSNHYSKGKFVADGHYDPNAVSRQCGAAVLLLRMEQRGIIEPLPR